MTDPLYIQITDDYRSLVKTFKETYFEPLKKGRLPSRKGVEFVQEGIEESRKGLGGLNLDQKAERWIKPYEFLDNAVRSYATVESDDLFEALFGDGEDLDIPPTKDPFELMAFAANREMVKKENSFLRLNSALSGLAGQIGTYLSSWIGTERANIHAKESKKSKIQFGNPLRSEVAKVISGLDDYYMDLVAGESSMMGFLKGTENFIDMCNPKTFPCLR